MPPDLPSEGLVVPPDLPSEGLVVPPDLPSEGLGVPPDWPSEGLVVPPDLPSEGLVVPPDLPSEGLAVPRPSKPLLSGMDPPMDVYCVVAWAMFDACAEWVKVFGEMGHWVGSHCFEGIREGGRGDATCGGGGGKGPVPFAPLIGNMVPMVVGEGGERPKRALPLRIVTSPRTLLHYMLGTGHRPKMWMKPFPMPDGSPAWEGELILLIVPPGAQATRGHQRKEVDTDSDSEYYAYICIYVLTSRFE